MTVGEVANFINQKTFEFQVIAGVQGGEKLPAFCMRSSGNSKAGSRIFLTAVWPNSITNLLQRVYCYQLNQKPNYPSASNSLRLASASSGNSEYLRMSPLRCDCMACSSNDLYSLSNFS